MMRIRNVTPADVYFGRQNELLTERSKIKRKAMERRNTWPRERQVRAKNCLLAKGLRCPDHFANVHERRT
jgi:hypothetical protein